MASNALESFAHYVQEGFFAGRMSAIGAPRLWIAIEDAIDVRPPHFTLLLHKLALGITPDKQLLKLMSVCELRHSGSFSTPEEKMRQVIVAVTMYYIIMDDETIKRIAATHYELNREEVSGLYTGYIAPHRAISPVAN